MLPIPGGKKYQTMKSLYFILFFAMVSLGAESCREDDDTTCTTCPNNDIITGDYNPQPFAITVPSWLPPVPVPPDNLLTTDGVALGRMLFYDPILSSDSTLSCASCHKQERAFTDGLAVSTGVLGISGKRSAMSLANLAYNTRGFFWDGRTGSLETQALIPVEDHIEMNENWDNVVQKFRNHATYPALFRKAFGIELKSQITKELAAKALAQFQRTLISGNSRYDQIIWAQQGWLTDQEQRGLELFFIEFAGTVQHPGCSHCHFNPLFTDNNFRQNGLEDVPDLLSFPDPGRGAISGIANDNGKFRVPTLRNIELTAPYMHDGRFATLEQVLDHYATGGHGVSNEDPNILPFVLDAQQKEDLIAFLKTLTDQTFLTNPNFSNPF